MNTFKIGTSQVGLVTLQSLGVPEPLSGYQPYSQEFDQADALVSGQGWATDTWRWAFLTLTQLSALRAYCSGKSAEVYIQTLVDGKTAGEFRAALIWPAKETRAGSKALDVALEFRLLEALEPLPEPEPEPEP
jgi:hypothetical protein